MTTVPRADVGTEKRYEVHGVTCELAGRTLPVVNLSAGGFFAASDVVPSRGEILEMRLHLPNGVVVSGLGRVAWVNPAANRVHLGLPPGCGVQNHRLAFSDKLAIVAALRHFTLPLARPASRSPLSA